MRIALVATTHAPIAASGGGSIEQIVWSLATELTLLGHQVTVFGQGGSVVDCAVVPTWHGTYGEPGVPGDARLADLISSCRAIERAGDFDVIHAHNYLTAVPLGGLVTTPIVNTLHVLPYDDEAEVLRAYPKAHVTALSRFQWHAYADVAPDVVIPHGVSTVEFALGVQPDDFLLYLGRFEPGKGADAAVQLARAADVPLVLAGPTTPYFEEYVRPHVDDDAIRYVGTVSGHERTRLLQRARALIYPIQQGEPFGLVLIEAMMCGTPVLARPVGAVPEIVDDGVTGFLSNHPEAWFAAVKRIDELDRRAIRWIAEQRFSSQRMARDYLRVYASAVAGAMLLDGPVR
jgi:glycosyltransferase involved in cell wall biosynthesis